MVSTTDSHKVLSFHFSARALVEEEVDICDKDRSVITFSHNLKILGSTMELKYGCAYTLSIHVKAIHDTAGVRSPYRVLYWV